MTPHELRNAVLTLQSNSSFHLGFTKMVAPRVMRDLISRFLRAESLPPGDKYDREQIRRYLCDCWELKVQTDFDGLSTIDPFADDPGPMPGDPDRRFAITPNQPPVQIGPAPKGYDDALHYLFNIIQPTKETTMNANIIDITTKTLINGVDIATLKDAEIYETIATQEAAIAKLEGIANKPARLVNEIDKRKAGIQALVDFLNTKDGVTTQAPTQAPVSKD